MDKIGKNYLDIQESNRSAVLKILSKGTVITRADIARWTGLKQATITNIINDLIASGVVIETGILKGSLGRRSIGIQMNGDKYTVLGVKIARRSYSLGVFDLHNRLLEQSKQKVDGNMDASVMLGNILSEAHTMIEKYKNCCAIGVAVSGPFLRRDGRIAVMSEFAGWESIDIREIMRDAFDVPVFIEHDANAGALGEWSHTQSFGTNDVLVHLLASEGIGTGVVLDGKIISGYRGIFGEVGHMSINAEGDKCVCGNYGCLETYCSALAFVKTVVTELPQHPESSLNSEEKITAEVIFEHMARGDEFCRSIVVRMGRYLGYGITNIVNAYDPREIVISDIMSGGGEIMLDAIKETVRDRLLPAVYKDLVIRYSSLSGDLILHGAAAVAIDNILKKTDIFFN